MQGILQIISRTVAKRLFLFLHNAFLGTFAFLAVLLSLFNCSNSAADHDFYPCIDDICSIEGFVIDENGPVSGAIVRIKTTDFFSVTDEDGKFLLNHLVNNKPVTVTAWAQGYYIGGGIECLPGEKNVNIFIEKHSSEDNSDYEWISSYAEAGDPKNCQNCHSGSAESLKLPYDDWITDAHAKSAENTRFLTMYSGTDVLGNQSPPTLYMYHPDYGSIPLLPDASQPYFGPGYKLDFPNTSGNCATCHTPLAAIENAYATDPTELESVFEEGISCDFCHKILDVILNPNTGEPYQNMPGVLSFIFRRPFDDRQLFTGPFDDVAPGDDVFSPVQRKSQYCAPCHSASFWDVKIYNSFGEWLESPYNDEQTGKTCQDCHMPAGLADHFALSETGGLIRNMNDIRSHRMLGATDRDFLVNAVTMSTNAYVENDSLKVHVEIVNDNTGHHVPTDSPLRHLILLVLAKDENGNGLELTNGPVLPAWCGKGNANEGYYAGLPGMAYAKVLREQWTEKEPTGAYWKQTQITSDNRIKAFETAASDYTFSAPEHGETTLEMRLIYRRAFIELADQKGWDKEDILIAQEFLVR